MFSSPLYFSGARSPCPVDAVTLQAQMYYYVGFYAWKNAIICQGIAARYAKGQASSADAGGVGRHALGRGALPIHRRRACACPAGNMMMPLCLDVFSLSHFVML